MWIVLLVLLVALMIPVVGIVIDSPIGRALARRLEGPEQAPPGLRELAKKVELLEAEVDDLTRAVKGLEEENQFLQRLLESSPRSTLRPAAMVAAGILLSRIVGLIRSRVLAHFLATSDAADAFAAAFRIPNLLQNL